MRNSEEKIELNSFGGHLRHFRNQTKDPRDGRSLSLMRFVGALDDFSDGQHSYSHATLQNWEKDKTTISPRDRTLLITILLVLKQFNGIRTPEDANALLISGGYLTLAPQELKKINPQWKISEQDQNIAAIASIFLLTIAAWIDNPSSKLRHLFPIDKTSPPERGTAFIVFWHWLHNSFPPRRVFSIIGWVICWLLIWGLSFPILCWPLSTPETAIFKLIIGLFLIPLCIAFHAWHWQAAHWEPFESVSNTHRFAFSLVGGVVGFNTAWSAMFGVALLVFDLGRVSLSDLPFSLQLLPAFIITAIAFISALSTPHVIWQAYSKLKFTRQDGYALAAFTMLSLIIGGGYYLSHTLFIDHPYTGTILIGLLLLATFILTTSQKSQNTPRIPRYGWVLLFAIPILLYTIYQLPPDQVLFVTVSLTLAISATYIWDRFQP